MTPPAVSIPRERGATSKSRRSLSRIPHVRAGSEFADGHRPIETADGKPFGPSGLHERRHQATVRRLHPCPDDRTSAKAVARSLDRIRSKVARFMNNRRSVEHRDSPRSETLPRGVPTLSRVRQSRGLLVPSKRTVLLQFVFLERAEIPQFQVSGFGEVKNFVSICARIGRLITTVMIGRSLIPPAMRQNPWLSNTGSRKAKTRTAENSTRAKSSNKRPSRQTDICHHCCHTSSSCTHNIPSHLRPSDGGCYKVFAPREGMTRHN